jgi:predicted HD phosphohydrolase
VRIWDDEGKKPGMKTPDFRHYVQLLQRVVERWQDGAA